MKNQTFFFQRKNTTIISSKGFTLAQLPKRHYDVTNEYDPYIEAEHEAKKATMQ